MKPHDKNLVNRLGKAIAGPLSRVVVNPASEEFARLFESYLGILLGKGAGAGWALRTEVNAAKTLIRSCRPIIFDVGANNGEWSFLIKDLIPEARIFLFEPQQACQNKILARCMPNVTLIPSAVSSEKRTVKLYTTAGAPAIASLHERKDTYFSGSSFTSNDVETVTLDSIIEGYGLDSVDFMKMDIEGHEFEALRGAERSLSKSKIKAFSFEFGSGNINSRTFFRDFWDLLSPLKYRFFRILPSSRLMPINEYYEDCEHFRGVTNYIAVLRKEGLESS